MIELIDHVLIGEGHLVVDAVVKTSALFSTATALFRFTEQRTLAEFAPFDWIAAVADRRVMAPEWVPTAERGPDDARSLWRLSAKAFADLQCCRQASPFFPTGRWGRRADEHIESGNSRWWSGRQGGP
jgi:hypothetical protein